MPRLLARIAFAILFGCMIVAVAALAQPHFVAGSLLDLLCELVLMPGKLFAIIFKDRGTASPEFLWRSYTFAAVFFGGVTYFVLPKRKSDS